MSDYTISRRKIIMAIAATPMITTQSWPSAAVAAQRSGDARIAIIGVGARGTRLLQTLLSVGSVSVTAIADINSDHAERAVAIIEEHGDSTPAVYIRGPDDYESLVARHDIDAVIIATPWRWHTPMAVTAMRAGKRVGVEVPAAITLDECWQLVRTSEATGVWCMMLENVCYARDLMQVQNMVRSGRFGELLHAAGGYKHDSRAMFDADGYFGTDTGTQSDWYPQYVVNHDGNLYPTHPLGPIAQCMNINRGDRFDYLVSISSKARGVNKWVRERYGSEHPNATRRFTLGDINTSVIKTRSGCTITLYYDTHSPRPYDLAIRVQGTHGIYEMCRDSVYIEHLSPRDQWETLEQYRDEYEHPLWRMLGDKAESGGHGGADYVMLHHFVDCITRDITPQQDVYDAASWSAVFPISEQSVAGAGRPILFPDFTNGRWKRRHPVPINGPAA